MDVVDEWTGRSANALRRALRMTQEDFADALGVSTRSVAVWHERPELVLSLDSQRRLDTAYEKSTNLAKLRFVRKLQAESAEAGEATGSPFGPGPLTVAVAVVMTDSDVLLVCRRDSEPSGITWQFPAGVVKPGQQPEKVAVRETYGETDVHCAVARELGARVHPRSGVYCHYFLCDYLAGEPRNMDPAENAAVSWVCRTEVTRYIQADILYPPALLALGRNRMTAEIQSDVAPIAAAIIVQQGRVLLVRRRVKEGTLSWQFPSGEVEEGETGTLAAAREAREEVGLTVKPLKVLGERVHPATGRTMIYVACEVANGEAYVADDDELAELEWCDNARLTEHVPYPLFGRVREYLDTVLR